MVVKATYNQSDHSVTPKELISEIINNYLLGDYSKITLKELRQQLNSVIDNLYTKYLLEAPLYEAMYQCTPNYLMEDNTFIVKILLHPEDVTPSIDIKKLANIKKVFVIANNIDNISNVNTGSNTIKYEAEKQGDVSNLFRFPNIYTLRQSVGYFFSSSYAEHINNDPIAYPLQSQVVLVSFGGSFNFVANGIYAIPEVQSISVGHTFKKINIATTVDLTDKFYIIGTRFPVKDTPELLPLIADSPNYLQPIDIPYKYINLVRLLMNKFICEVLNKATDLQLTIQEIASEVQILGVSDAQLQQQK
jgi:hypothetical protein